MIDVEDRLRAGLEDGGWDRPLPHDPIGWIAAEASRQRLRRLPVVTAAAAVVLGAGFVVTTQLNRTSGFSYGSSGPQPTPSSCAGFVHPSNGVPVWPNEVAAVVRAAADFDAWRIKDSQRVVDCRGSGYQVGAVLQLDPVDPAAGPLEVARVIAHQVTAADLPVLAASGLAGADVHDVPAVEGADATLVATTAHETRVLAWSAQTETFVTVTQSLETTPGHTLTTAHLADLARALLTLYTRSRY